MLKEPPKNESLASMGPGLFSPEDVSQTGNSAIPFRASMGPGLFSPEDGNPVGGTAGTGAGFNGAGLIQPGGHD